MENMDNSVARGEEIPSYQYHEDEELVMSDIVQDDPELMYLHVCLSEVLCKKGGTEGV